MKPGGVITKITAVGAMGLALVLGDGLKKEVKAEVNETKGKLADVLTPGNHTALAQTNLANLKTQLPSISGGGEDGIEPSGIYKTLEELGLDRSVLEAEVAQIKTPSQKHLFIMKLTDMLILGSEIESLFPATKIKDAPEPLGGVVPDGQEKNIVSIESLGLPEQITEENYGDFMKSMLIPRLDDPEYVDRFTTKFIEDKVLPNKELFEKVLNSWNLYLEFIKTTNNQYVDGKQGEVNPYLTERGFTRLAFSQYYREIDPNLEGTNGLAFLSDLYYLRIALGGDIDRTKNKAVFDETGLSNIVMPITKDVGLSMASMGVDLPTELLVDYNNIYKDYLSKFKTPKIASKYSKKFDGLSLISRVTILDYFPQLAVEGDGSMLRNHHLVARLYKVFNSLEQKDGKATVQFNAMCKKVGLDPSEGDLAELGYIVETVDGELKKEIAEQEEWLASLNEEGKKLDAELEKEKIEGKRLDAELEKEKTELEKEKTELEREKNIGRVIDNLIKAIG